MQMRLRWYLPSGGVVYPANGGRDLGLDRRETG